MNIQLQQKTLHVIISLLLSYTRRSWSKHVQRRDVFPARTLSFKSPTRHPTPNLIATQWLLLALLLHPFTPLKHLLP